MCKHNQGQYMYLQTFLVQCTLPYWDIFSQKVSCWYLLYSWRNCPYKSVSDEQTGGHKDGRTNTHTVCAKTFYIFLQRDITNSCINFPFRFPICLRNMSIVKTNIKLSVNEYVRSWQYFKSTKIKVTENCIITQSKQGGGPLKKKYRKTAH